MEKTKEVEATTEAQKQKTRSPAYPAFPLKEAIQKAGIVKTKDGRASVRRENVAAHWGYSAKSSGGKVAVATLIKYGLLQEVEDGQKVKLTDLAYEILVRQPETSEWKDAIKKAALSPKIHSHLWKTYGEELPSDVTLRSTLILDHKFNEDKVDDFIKTYRSTVQFAGLTKNDKIEEQEEGEGGDESSSGNGGGGFAPAPSAFGSDSKKPEGKLAYHEARFPLMSGEALMRVPVSLTQDDIDTLFTTYLNGWKKLLEKKLKEPKAGDEEKEKN